MRTPVFDGATDVAIEDDLAGPSIAQKAGLINLDPMKEKTAKTIAAAANAWLNKRGYDGDKVFDDNHPGFAREICLRLWLEEQGVGDARD